LAAILGSNLESQSRGTEMSIGPGFGDHRLGPVAITGIAAIAAGRVMPGIAHVVIQLAFDHHHGQPV